MFTGTVQTRRGDISQPRGDSLSHVPFNISARPGDAITATYRDASPARHVASGSLTVLARATVGVTPTPVILSNHGPSTPGILVTVHDVNVTKGTSLSATVTSYNDSSLSDAVVVALTETGIATGLYTGLVPPFLLACLANYQIIVNN